MGYALPWNVRGIDPDIKELAVEAAHRAGMPVGQWLSHVLADTLPDMLDDEEEVILPRRRSRQRSSRINKMNARLERILRPRNTQRYNDNSEDDGEAYELLETALQAMENGKAEQRPAPSSRENAALLKAIQSLEEQVSELKSQQNTVPPAHIVQTLPQNSPHVQSAIHAPHVQAAAHTQHMQAAAHLPHMQAAAHLPHMQAAAHLPHMQAAAHLPHVQAAAHAPYVQPVIHAPHMQAAIQSPHLQTAIDEIEARRRVLDSGSAPQPIPHATPQATAPKQPEPEPEPQAIPPKQPEPDPLMDDLRRRLDTLMTRFDEVNAKPDPISQALQTRLDQIASQLDFVTKAPRPDVQIVQAKLDQISARLDATQAAPRQESVQLHNHLETIAKRIDDLTGHQKPDTSHLQARLEHIASRIEEVRNVAQQEPPRLSERMDHIAGRIDGWKAPTQDDLLSIRRDLSQLAHSLEAISPQRLVGIVEDAVAQVAEKSYNAQKQNLPDRLIVPIEQIQDDIREVLREVGSSRLSDRVTHEISIIARKLDQIGKGTSDIRRIDEILQETNAIKSLVTQAVRNQPLEGLAKQIEILGRHLDIFQRDPQNFSDQKLLDTIQDIRDRVDRIDPHATFAGMESRLKVIADIEARLGSITGIEEKLGEIARTVTQLTKDKRETPANSENTMPHLETITAKLDKIAHSIDRTASSPASESSEIAEKQQILMQLLERLSSKIEDAHEGNLALGSLNTIQNQISQLANKIEDNKGNPNGFNDIVKNLTSLCTEIELAKRDMVSLAESTAERAAREAIRNYARDESTETLAAEGLLLMRRDLGEFKNAQNESELRTQKTLQNLQETLHGLVSRFADVENNTSQQREKASFFTQAFSKSEPPITVADPPSLHTPLEQNPTSPKQNLAKLGATAKAQKSAQNIEFNDLPLEPGVQPDLSTVPPAEMTSADPKSNFIASARRAVQLAATQPKAQSDEPHTEVDQPLETTEKPKGQVRHLPPKTSVVGKTRKFFFLLLGTVVFTAGAMSLMTMRNPMPNVGDKNTISDIPLSKQNRELDKQKQGDLGAQGKRGNSSSQPAQSTPNNQLEVPQSSPKPAKPTSPNSEGAKQNQRLSELDGSLQADPLAVGSISTEGVQKTSSLNGELVELASQSQLKAQDKLREAALAANPAAIFEIGSRLLEGKGGLPKDIQLAARWFEKAAHLGHAPSQYRLAGLYREGRGHPKDAAVAFEWFEKAATQGHVLAMHNAAVLLAEGVHGTPDYANAAQWFKKAAEFGIKDSQFNIAILYARGLGLNQDLIESYRWFSSAAAQGDQDAVKKRDDIAARLTKDQLAKEKDWVKSFKPQKADPLANEPGAWEQDVSRTAAQSTPPVTNAKTQRAK